VDVVDRGPQSGPPNNFGVAPSMWTRRCRSIFTENICAENTPNSARLPGWATCRAHWATFLELLAVAENVLEQLQRPGGGRFGLHLEWLAAVSELEMHYEIFHFEILKKFHLHFPKYFKTPFWNISWNF